jgi:hypothetical protein
LPQPGWSAAARRSTLAFTNDRSNSQVRSPWFLLNCRIITPFPRRQSMPRQSTHPFLMLGNNLPKFLRRTRESSPRLLSAAEDQSVRNQAAEGRTKIVVALFKRVNEREYLTTVGETVVALEGSFQALACTSMEISELAQLRGGYSGIVSGTTGVALICRRQLMVSVACDEPGIRQL